MIPGVMIGTEASIMAIGLQYRLHQPKQILSKSDAILPECTTLQYCLSTLPLILKAMQYCLSTLPLILKAMQHCLSTLPLMLVVLLSHPGEVRGTLCSSLLHLCKWPCSKVR